ncbi:MAG: OmpA family protein [Bacteroidales bacterium]|nr:OmpA family protein [Bacteroidales bacterium]
MKLAICILYCLINLTITAQDSKYVYFESDDYTIDSAGKVTISETVNEQLGQDGYYIYLSGFTDSDGNDSYNMKLSFQRVSEVRNRLIDLGINPINIKMDWSGERNPFADNVTDEGKQKNRCVELHSSYYPPEDFNEMLSYHNYFNEDQIEDQYFSGFSDVKISIVGKKGTIINIPANSLVDERGVEYVGIVKITLKEVYSISDMVESNLSTTSGEKILETGGMFKIDVKGNNGSLSLKPGEYAQVLMPSTDPKTGMKVFYGNYQNGVIDWSTDGSKENVISIVELEQEMEQETDTITREIFNNFRLDVSAVKDPVIQENQENSAYNQNYYGFQIKGFNWINCDRYIGKEATSKLFVSVNSKKVAKVVLVLDEIKSLVNGNYNPALDIVTFPELPNNMSATIMAICVDQDGTYVETKNVVIGKEKTVKLFPVKISDEGMKSAIAALGIE